MVRLHATYCLCVSWLVGVLAEHQMSQTRKLFARNRHGQAQR